MLFWPRSSGCCCEEGGRTVCSDLCGLTLYMTDSNGTHTMNPYSSGSGPSLACWWECCYTFTHPVTHLFDLFFGTCTSRGSGTIAVAYKLECIPGPPLMLRLIEFNTIIDCPPAGFPEDFSFRRNDACVTDGLPTATASGQEDDASPGLNPVSATFTMTNPMGVGGNPWAVTGTHTVSE
jgi:hypothetical protein